MAEQPVHFDLKTIAILRETLDDAWDCLWPDERARTSRTILAESILKLAATGERDTERLLHAALMAVNDEPKTDAAQLPANLAARRRPGARSARTALEQQRIAEIGPTMGPPNLLKIKSII